MKLSACKSGKYIYIPGVLFDHLPIIYISWLNVWYIRSWKQNKGSSRMQIMKCSVHSHDLVHLAESNAFMNVIVSFLLIQPHGHFVGCSLRCRWTVLHYTDVFLIFSHINFCGLFADSSKSPLKAYLCPVCLKYLSFPFRSLESTWKASGNSPSLSLHEEHRKKVT